MPTIFDAEKYVGQRLQALPGRPPIAYPNISPTPGLPRIVIQTTGLADDTAMLSGFAKRETAEFSLQVEAEEGKGEDYAKDMALKIRALYPVGSGAGGVQIGSTSVRPPIKMAGYVAVPVLVQVRYFTDA